MFGYKKIVILIKVLLVFLFISLGTLGGATLVLKNNVKLKSRKVCFKDIGKIDGKLKSYDLKNWEKKCFYRLTAKQDKLTLSKASIQLYLIENNLFFDKVSGDKVYFTFPVSNIKDDYLIGLIRKRLNLSDSDSILLTQELPKVVFGSKFSIFPKTRNKRNKTLQIKLPAKDIHGKSIYSLSFEVNYGKLVLPSKVKVENWEIRVGQKLKLDFENSWLKAKIQVTAMQQGKLGEFIRVRGINKKYFKAKIIGYNKVVLEN